MARKNDGRKGGRPGNDPLEASSENYMNFIEHSMYGFFAMNERMEITYLNDMAKRMYGISGSLNKPLPINELLTPGDLEEALKGIREISETGAFPEPHVYTLVRPDGSRRRIEVHTIPIIRDGKFAGSHGTVMDVTEKLASQAALKEKSEFLDAVISSTSDGLFVLDEDFNYVLINPASGRIMGHDPEEWIGKRAGTNKHPDDEAKAMEAIQEVYANGHSECKIRVKSSDGKYHLLHIRYTLMAYGGKDHILGLVSDITERQMLEEAMRQSEEKYRNLFECSPDALVLIGEDRRVTECNNAVLRLLALPREDVIGRSVTELFIMDDADKDYYRGVFESLLHGSKVENIECEIITLDGRRLWLEAFPTVVSCGPGQHQFQVVCRDITERKRKEEGVRKRLMRFDLEPGNVYLAREAEPSASLTAFRDLVSLGNLGLLVSRYRRKDSGRKLDLACMHVLVSDSGLPDTVKATPKGILELFSGLSRRQAVMLDCLDYIVSRLGERRAVNLVQDIADVAMKKNLVVIMSLDPKSVSKSAMNLFAKEMRDLRPCESLPKLSEKQLELVEYIGRANAEGESPTYTQAGQWLGLSKPTVRARVRELKEMGAVAEKAHGRTKRLDLTDKGSMYMAQ